MADRTFVAGLDTGSFTGITELKRAAPNGDPADPTNVGEWVNRIILHGGDTAALRDRIVQLLTVYGLQDGPESEPSKPWEDAWAPMAVGKVLREDGSVVTEVIVRVPPKGTFELDPSWG